MKYLPLVFLATLGFSSTALAVDDDFGARFTEQAPAALDDQENDGSLGIENLPPELIEPAAGDYFDSETQDVEEENKQSETNEAQEIDL